MDKLLCRFTKVKNNRLLNRVQMVVDCYHGADQNVTKDQLIDAIKGRFKKNFVSVIQVKKLYGGGRTKGYALVYDNEEAMKKYEPAKRLARVEREHMAPKDRKKSAGKGKKEGRKVKKVKKHTGQKKRGTKRRQEKELKRKQDKKKKK